MTLMHHLHDLNQLRVLDALLTERSVTGAARRLKLSQPAVSHALARLRLTFDDPLLVRSGRGMALTARAEALAVRLHEALAGLEAVVSERPGWDPSTARRTFSIATADYGELAVLPDLLPRLATLAPHVDLRVQRPTFPEYHVLEQADLVLTVPRGDEAPAGVRSRALLRDRFVVVLHRDHPLAGGMTVEQYAAARHAFIAPRGSPGGVVDEALARRGLTRRVAVMVPHFLVIPHIIARTDLVVTLAERVARAFSHLPIVAVPPPLDLPGFTVAMVWHERLDTDPGHAWLRRLLVEVCGSGA
jgi:DNA-binding transcriptional LysR family regulator